MAQSNLHVVQCVFIAKSAIVLREYSFVKQKEVAKHTKVNQQLVSLTLAGCDSGIMSEAIVESYVHRSHPQRCALLTKPDYVHLMGIAYLGISKALWDLKVHTFHMLRERALRGAGSVEPVCVVPSHHGALVTRSFEPHPLSRQQFRPPTFQS